MKIKTKKIPRQLLTLSLTVPFVICFGFLSFGGIFPLWSSIALAATCYGFYMMYDGEVVRQNVKNGLKKLFGYDYVEKRLTGEFLQENLVENILSRADCPAFFKEYAETLREYSLKKDKVAKKKLKIMEEMIALHLFSEKELDDNALEQDKALRAFIRAHFQEAILQRRQGRLIKYRLTMIFSVLVSLFTIPGLFFLLADTVAALPFVITLMAIPGVQIPLLVLAAILVPLASIAYGICVYNAITDMINNDTIKTWYEKIVNQWKDGITVRSVFLTVFSVVLVGLALFLTGCTAGTWWTIVQEAKPFTILMTGKGKQAAAILMGIINPIIMFFSNFFFNVQNVSQTYEEVEKQILAREKDKRSFSQKWDDFSQDLRLRWGRLLMRENIFQIINLPRLFLKTILFPLEVILFIGHLASGSVEGDKAPFVSPWFAFGMDFLSEGSEHFLYAFPVEHKLSPNASLKEIVDAYFSGETHDHGINIPLFVIKTCLSPLFLLAAVWHWGFGKLNSDKGDYTPKPVAFMDAVKRSFGMKHKHPESGSMLLKPAENLPLSPLEYSMVNHEIEKQKTRLDQVIINKKEAKEKVDVLQNFQNRHLLNQDAPEKRKHFTKNLADLSHHPVLNKARMFQSASTPHVMHGLHKAVRCGM